MASIRTSLFWPFVALWLGSAQPAPAAEKLREVRTCKQVLVQLERADHQEVGERVAEFVCQKARALTPLFRLNKGQLVLVRMAGDSNSFARLTGKSFFTLAVFRAQGLGDMIITQPAEQLGDTKKVQAVLTHELTHLMIRRATGGRCPTWINEGLAQWFEGRRTQAPPPADADRLAGLEGRWHDQATPVAQRRQDYLASLAAVSQLIDQVGEGAFLAAVLSLRKSNDVMDLDLEGRSLARRLFQDGPRPAPPAAAARDDEPQGPQEPADGGMTRLPLQQMLEKAKKKRKKP